MSNDIAGPEHSDDRDRLRRPGLGSAQRRRRRGERQRAAGPPPSYSPSERAGDGRVADGAARRRRPARGRHRPLPIVAAPGTGGADDAGDVEPEPGDLHLPWQSEEDRQG